ncbi:MAG: Si-specific NAD(P)(+) transhydrogenase [Chlamydiales bacterium]|nr:Si-specific NAD(P)(+) transhydrogenase [Chlamydiia bacterium]MCP5507221.1 Si-specific NAD(P)(+) transhydrogenase [Chlamydiales bacterium]
MEDVEADVVVIGTGPAGQKAAIQCAKLNKRVVIIEKGLDPGGNCLYSGTIPSKSLREAIIDLTRFHERHFLVDTTDFEKVTINDLYQRLNRTIEEERLMIHRQFKKNNIRLIQGTARFETSKKVVVVDDSYRLSYQVSADKFIIATGSVPRNPIHVPFDNEVILDSTRLLGIDKVPDTMIVLGGGIIGSEYASFFAALGTEVTVFDKRDHLLPLLDSEIGIHLQTALTDIGMKFVGGKKPTEIKRVGDRAKVTFEDGDSMEADTLLFCLGRHANVEGLNIESAGLNVNEEGYLDVNELFQTRGQPHIYAVGDVIGAPALASTSMEQGRLAARHACGVKTHRFPTFYPIGIYTIPEISSCGYTEDELKELGFRYEVGRAYYYEIARSHIVGTNRGLFKILFHAETLEILGIHIIGRAATEVIHIGQVAVTFNAKIDYFIDHIFNYPTYAEGYRVAALNGINKIKHRI